MNKVKTNFEVESWLWARGSWQKAVGREQLAMWLAVGSQI
jgi:hypothetical protein